MLTFDKRILSNWHVPDRVGRIFKQLVIAIRFFTAKRVLSQASALTYSTLLAIVPILAVVFAIGRGFGYNKYIEVWFRGALSSQPQVAEIIIGFVNSYLVHTKSGIFLGVGLAFMLYTVLMLVSNIEQAFNQIWQVKKQRSIFRTVTDYLAMFFLFPIIIVPTTGISIFVSTITSQMSANYMLLAPVVRFLIDLAPFALMSALFIAMYVFMPNTHVNLRSAIVPGILAGIAMQWLQLFYIHSQMWVTGYNAIYGSFAALPLFMLWLQISWTICLFGAELSYTNQNLDYFDFSDQASNISHRYKLLLCAMIMGQVCRRFSNGGSPLTALQIRQATDIPLRVVNDLLYMLIDARLIIEITSDEKGETSQFVPAESLNNLTLGVMIDRLEAQGKWHINIDVGKLKSAKWRDALTHRTQYLDAQRDILLQDL